MKSKTFTLSDFQAEKINNEAKRIIRGGGNDATDTDTPSYPLKTNGGGNG